MDKFIFGDEDGLIVVGDWEVRAKSKTIYIQHLDDDLQVIKTSFYEVNTEEWSDEET